MLIDHAIRSPWGGCVLFTGKERDTESGNDYFGARYYNSATGRWLSSDPIQVTKDRLEDPQQLNLYEYARNSPLQIVDDDGRDIHIVITSAPTGDTSTVRRYTADEIQKNPSLKQQQVSESVPTYTMLISNDSGEGRVDEVTRDSIRNGSAEEERGNYGTGDEAPPGLYSGSINTGGTLGFRVDESDLNRPGTGQINGPDGVRIGLAIHIGPGASEGCQLLTGGQIGRQNFENEINSLMDEDRRNRLGTKITVRIQNRTPIETEDVHLTSMLTQ